MFSSWKLCCERIQQRWVFALMGCFAGVNAYTMRVCLSVAITEMVVPTGGWGRCVVMDCRLVHKDTENECHEREEVIGYNLLNPAGHFHHHGFLLEKQPVTKVQKVENDTNSDRTVEQPST